MAEGANTRSVLLLMVRAIYIPARMNRSGKEKYFKKSISYATFLAFFKICSRNKFVAKDARC